MAARYTKFDIGAIRTPNDKSKRPQIVSNSNFLTQEIDTPIVPRKKTSRWVIVPFASAVLILMLLIQSLVYLSGARRAKGQILGAATSAYSDLSSASNNLKDQNLTDAASLFSSALSNLQDAQNKLDQYKALQLIAPQAKSADHLLAAASLLAAAGGRLASSMSLFDDSKNDPNAKDLGLTDQLARNKTSLDSTLFLLNQAQSEFNLATNLPASYADTVQKAKDQVNALTGTLRNLVDLENIYLGMFNSGPKTFLLVFQNYDEVRATGGFIGTYGVAKIDHGKIQNLKIDSIYDLDGHIYDKIAAPGPFQPDIQKWGIRDANWFADFPTSARKLLDFYEKGAETADGVIAVTPNLFQDILTLTGPIPMPDYGVTLTSDNFQDVVQYKTSVDYDKKLNQPKKFLADFAPILLNKLATLDKQSWIQILQMFEANLNQKQIMLYATDPFLEEKIQSLKFSGEILPTDEDYLDVVNTNLGGTKTDLSIDQKVNLETKIDSDGKITDTLSVTRTNNSVLLNKDFIRILVPTGSNLIYSSGFDAGTFEPSTAAGFKTDPDLANWDQGQVSDRVFIRSESGKTEFSGWTISNGGETKTLTLVYTIPYRLNLNLFKSSASYSLLFQKQDGVKPYGFAASVDMGNLHPRWTSADTQYASGKVQFNYTTGSDQYWAILLTK